MCGQDIIETAVYGTNNHLNDSYVPVEPDESQIGVANGGKREISGERALTASRTALQVGGSILQVYPNPTLLSQPDRPAISIGIASP